MKYIVFAVFVLHFLLLTVSVRAKIETGGDKCNIKIALWFIPVFKKTIDFSKLPSPAGDENEHKAVTENKPENTFVKTFAKQLVKRITINYLYIDGAAGTGDAASTAVIVGSVNAAICGACAFFGYRDCGRIRPEYDTATINVTSDGIISINFANIIIAALLSFKRKRKRRLYGSPIPE